MNDAPILSDDEPVSMPSMRTQWGGDPAALGRIDHYDILSKLGDGGFGVVYLAKDTVSGVEVAIKTLHPRLKHNADEMDLLREKFRLVSRLSHPNIATALVLHPCRDINIRDDVARSELKLSPGDSVMVMRYAPGVTLSKWRRQFPDGIVPPDLALEIGRQIAAALDYAHGERIVHRDIKPGNIMVETLEGGRVRARILDFGLAAEIRSSMSRVSTEQGDTSGTRPYMAPEQWLGKKQDGRTDQYALACVLYELLSGTPPFAGVFETGDPMIMRTAVTTDSPDELQDTSPAINTALLRALAKSPKDRFHSCAEFVKALVCNRAEKCSRIDCKERDLSADNPKKEQSVRDAAKRSRQNSISTETTPGTLQTIEIAPGIPMDFCWCPATTSESWKRISDGDIFFRMGVYVAERKHDKYGDVVTLGVPVKLTKGFWMGRFPVTQEQWTAVMGNNPSKCLHGKNLFGFGGKTSPRRPVDSVSWHDCVRFLVRCQEITGIPFALPTEAQYEFAARAGMKNGRVSTCHNTMLDGVLKEHFPWFSFEPFFSSPVDEVGRNNWKIQACFGPGCVWQWCSDWKGNEWYDSNSLQDPIGPASGDFRVLKGGCISAYLIVPHLEFHEAASSLAAMRSIVPDYIPDYDDDIAVSCSNRYWADPSFRNRAVGFRVCFQDA